jgi:hypothetical protein
MPNPFSNAWVFNPPPPDTSPEGFPLYYKVHRDAETGKSIPGQAWYVYDDAGHTCETVDEARAALRRKPERAKALAREMERWKAETFRGPVPVETLRRDTGACAYLARRYADYALATGNRDIFRDVCSGTNPEIAVAMMIGDAHRNQGMPVDPALVALVDQLEATHRKV